MIVAAAGTPRGAGRGGGLVVPAPGWAGTAPPITAALQELGKVSKNTVAASMRSQGLVARPKRKRRGLTRADRRARKAPDLLKRDFAPPPAVTSGGCRT